MTRREIRLAGLCVREWVPEPVRGHLLYVHGGGEHGGRHEESAARFASMGIHVLMPDLRGHGKSPGPRAHIESLEQHCEDLRAIAATFGQPWTAFGHSLGGLLVLKLSREPAKGLTAVAVTSPFLVSRFPLPRWKEVMGRALARLVPRVRIKTGIPPESLTRTPEVVAAFERDPLNSCFVTARGGCAILDGAAAFRARVEAFPVPILVLQGSGDRIADPQATREFVRAHALEYVEFAGLYHELLNEPEREQVYSVLSSWCARWRR